MTPSYQPRGVRNTHDVEILFPPTIRHTSVSISNVFESCQWLAQEEQIEAIHSKCPDGRAIHVVREANAGVRLQGARANGEITDKGYEEGIEGIPWRRWIKAERNLQYQLGKLWCWPHCFGWVKLED